ncbi:MAG TPA: RodZ domain-containing protein [Candidatus Angelobacter sp.]|jgi:cytoskeleton protein RodZ|nr:RodZ domain-containing protein [Candidatus Angelobacter sp.]
MGAFGDRMRREREMRGVTLEEISESTKISKRALQALEEEDFDLLPGGIFNKGFVRAYARFLGIDEEQAVADFVAADTVNHAPEVESKFPLNLEDRAAKPPLNPKRSLTPVLLALLLLAAAAGGWTIWNKHKAQRAANESPFGDTAIPANKPPEQLPAAQAAQATTNDVSTTASPAGDAANPAGSNQKTVSSQSTPASDSNSPSDTSNSDNLSSIDSTQLFTVSIKATEDSWISITADGKPPKEYNLAPEKQRSVTAGKKLVLVTGNAGGIEVSYNGKPLAPIGKKSKKQTVIFTPHGYELR